MITVEYVIFSTITGIMLGTFYGLATIGLSFTFGILRILNSGHGSLVMIGAYISYWGFTLMGLSPLISALLAFVMGFLIGLMLYYGLISRVLGGPELISLVIMFAFGIFLQEVAKFTWGASPRGFTLGLGSINIFGYEYPLTRVIGGVISAVIVVALYVFLFKTKSGNAIRSVVENPEGAALCGVNVSRVYALSLAIALGLTVASGALSTLFVAGGIEPYMGDLYTSRAFAIAVLGGLTSPFGSFLAGLLFGIFENLSYMTLSLANIGNPFSMTRFLTFAMILLVLLVRPQGLLKR